MIPEGGFWMGLMLQGFSESKLTFYQYHLLSPIFDQLLSGGGNGNKDSGTSLNYWICSFCMVRCHQNKNS